MLLYKYCRPYRKNDVAGKIVEDLFRRLLVRFTQPAKLHFNDPFDCRPEFRANPESFNQELLKAKARLQKSGKINVDDWPLEEKILYEGRMSERRKQRVQELISHPEKMEDAHLSSLIERLGKEIGILCLCEEPDNIRMWSHYADNHTGFVVGFDTGTDFFAKKPHEPGEIGELRKVTYSKNRPIVPTPFTEESSDVDFLFTKHHRWCDEKERRILRFLSDAAESENGVYLFALPPSAIREIIFGSYANETKEPSIEPTLKFIENNPDLRNVKIKQARLARNGYKIEIVDFPAP